MAEHAPAEAAPRRKRGWLKALLGAAGGVLSGVLAMYFTAFVDKAVKPARPLPNFRCVPAGLTVQFQNLSESGSGWWDFGDGAPLEPVAADRPFVSHTYPRPGGYTVKMTLHNLLNEEAERAVALRLEAEAPAEPPRIQALEATPLSAGSYAPATFRLRALVRNARVCVLDFDDDQPLEVCTDPDNLPERLVTFRKPGGYVIKAAAVNGAQYDEKTEVVTVMEPPDGSIAAVLTAAGSAEQVETQTRASTFGAAMPADCAAGACKVDLAEQATPGWVIADLRLKGPDGREWALGSQTEMALDAATLGLHDARDLKLQLSTDRRSARLTGELVRDPSRQGQSCALALPATVVEQRRSAVELKPQRVTATLPLPAGGVSGTAALPLPPLDKGCEKVQRRLTLELYDGDQVVWRDDGAVHSGLVSLQGKPCIAAATLQADQVRVDLLPAPSWPVVGAK
jgi:hypothetical protein